MGVEDRQERDRLDRRREQPDARGRTGARRSRTAATARACRAPRRRRARACRRRSGCSASAWRDAGAAAVGEREQVVQQVGEGRRVGEVVRVEVVLREHRDRPRHEMVGLVGVVDVGQPLANAPQAQAESRRGAPPRAPARPSRRGIPRRCPDRSAVAIDRVVAARVDALEAVQRNLVARIVADVDDRLDEHGAAQRVDGDAAPRGCASRARARPCSASARAWLRATMSCWPTLSRIQRASGISLLSGSDTQRTAPQLGLDRGLGSAAARPLWKSSW